MTTSEWANDPWIKDWSPIHPAKMHALGRIAIAWTTCETNLFLLFCSISELKPKRAWTIVHEMGDIALSDRMKVIAVERGFFPEELSALHHFLEVYDLCRQNRNSFTHFKIGTEKGEIVLIRVKGPNLILHPLPNELKDFRRVAEECAQLSKSLRLLWNAFTSRLGPQIWPLPNTLPLPKLIWKPPQQDPKVRQPRRPPSVPKLSKRQKRAKAKKEARIRASR